MQKAIRKTETKQIDKHTVHLTPYLTKTLNRKMLLLFICTNLFSLSIMFYIIKSSNSDESIQISNLRSSLIEEIQKMKSSNVIIQKVQSPNNQLEMQKLREEIILKVSDINEKYQDLLDRKQSYFNSTIKEVIKRKPASAAIKNAGVIIFSEQNLQVLKKSQYLERKRFKEDLLEQEKKLMSSLDLTNPVDQKLLRDFQDTVKLQITELEEKHWEEKKRLRKDKYLVVSKN